MTEEWREFAEKTKNDDPSPLLVEALSLVTTRDRALELGSGGGSDPRHLHEAGFKRVDAVDIRPEAAEYLPKEVVFTPSAFDAYEFPVDAYDLANAQHALAFNPPQSFDQMFERLKRSLREGAVLTMKLLGPDDSWRDERPDMSFHTEEDVRRLLEGFDIIKLEERQYDGSPSVGDAKHWHVWSVIARKKPTS